MFLFFFFPIGVNTIASYTGPLLITNFVNFLLVKEDNSSTYYGLILAFIFFFARIVELLSQKQWYLGAQRNGIQLRATLMVLIYKKSLSTKYVGLTNGKIINLINVDAKRIGDFCWLIYCNHIFVVIDNCFMFVIAIDYKIIDILNIFVAISCLSL